MDITSNFSQSSCSNIKFELNEATKQLESTCLTPVMRPDCSNLLQVVKHNCRVI